ncbi:hypothetical protein HK097_004287, partial [Rhizophlyctis rosea]
MASNPIPLSGFTALLQHTDQQRRPNLIDKYIKDARERQQLLKEEEKARRVA